MIILLMFDFQKTILKNISVWGMSAKNTLSLDLGRCHTTKPGSGLFIPNIFHP